FPPPVSHELPVGQWTRRAAAGGAGPAGVAAPSAARASATPSPARLRPLTSRPPIVRLRSASLSPSVGRHGFLVTGSGAPPADAEGAVVAAAPSSATSAAAAR